MFQGEFEAYINCMSYPCGVVGTISEYKIVLDEKPSENIFKFDALDGSGSCSCKKFEAVGIQCCHVLKVLDLKNIKGLPEQYILKRWRKDARSVQIGEEPTYGSGSVMQSASEARFNNMCRLASLIASRASKSEEAMSYVESQSSVLLKHLDKNQAGHEDVMQADAVQADGVHVSPDMVSLTFLQGASTFLERASTATVEG